MISAAPHILLVNPWIHDYAAYDFWARPLGLLYIGAVLRDHGYRVSYIDCLNRFHSKLPFTDPGKRSGRGPYPKTRLPKPELLLDVPRHYSRYGIRPEWLREDLLGLDGPDLILVTSLMAYWYPGVMETLSVLGEVFPGTRVLLGGVYARLWTEHARTKTTQGTERTQGTEGTEMTGESGSLIEVTTDPDEADVLARVSEITGFFPSPRIGSGGLDSLPYPALDLQDVIPFAPILTSRGCPFSCAYCASGFLEPRFRRREPLSVVEEIRYWHDKYRVIDFVFYDDALLMNSETHALPLFEAILKADLRLRFHTPNAVHIRGINRETARLMAKIGFQTLRLGLETAVFEDREKLDRKVEAAEFSWAAACLKDAGFSKEEVGAYLLFGLPEQDLDAFADSVEVVKKSGITPIPAYYSPIPHTSLWEKAVSTSRYRLARDPIYTNNAVMPCLPDFSWEMVSWIKGLTA